MCCPFYVGGYLRVCVRVKLSEGIIFFFCHGCSLPLSELLLSSKRRSPVLFPHCSLLHCTASPNCYPETSSPLWRMKKIFPLFYHSLIELSLWTDICIHGHVPCYAKQHVSDAQPQYKFTKSMTLGTLLKWWPSGQFSTTTQNGWKQALNVTVANPNPNPSTLLLY